MQPVKRDEVWASIQNPWDIIVVGGGITGAGIFRYATAAGLQTLLLEADDFAFGTSSKSSKLVHGGLRYLEQKQFDITYESVRERERLLRDVPELVEPLRFLISNYTGQETSTKKYLLGLVIYDIMGTKWKHGRMKREKMLSICPQINPVGLKDGLFYYDAVVDDARLVYRLIQEGKRLGGIALNYASVCGLMKNTGKQVNGVVVQRMDGDKGAALELPAKVVINATGPWTDTLREMVDREPVIRKQRGSHLVIDGNKLPLTHAITFTHPQDHRTMFFVPWNGATIVGTTDLDHPARYEAIANEPFVDRPEFDYIMQAVHDVFPSAGIGDKDIVSTYSGLRPIIRADSSSPSAQSRKHEVYEEDGLLTITGGKLTTFRVMARAVLERAIPMLEDGVRIQWNRTLYDRRYTQTAAAISAPQHLVNRYGSPLIDWLKTLDDTDFSPLPGQTITPLEIYYAAQNEEVVHLDDLLLRRVRLGLISRSGGEQYLPVLKTRLLQIMGWSEQHWQKEVDRYQNIIQESYSLPSVS